MKPQKEGISQVKNIVISGTNFWNPGDDFVRDGVVEILKNLFHGYQLNFLFYNFNQDFFPQSKFTGIANTVAKGDLNRYSEHVHAVVIAGLSAGLEINDLYNWIIDSSLLNRVYLIGAGYENDYVDKHISLEPAATIFKNARIIMGRTRKKPKFIADNKLPYHHVNCPAILSVPDVKYIPQDKRIQKIAFSIQLPHRIGIANQSCAESMHKLAMNIFFKLYHEYEIEIIAHHKSEYFYFVKLLQELGLDVTVNFSSFYQDMFDVYRKHDLIIATRLHACLYGNSHGIPGIVLNDTERHTHCLEGFPHSVWVNSKDRFDKAFREINRWNFAQVADNAKKFKDQLLNTYMYVLAEAFGLNFEKMNTLREPRASKIVQLPFIGRRHAQDSSDTGEQQPALDVFDNNDGESRDSSASDLAKLLCDSLAGDVDTKRRVLNVFNHLTKDYYLEKNIENYHRFIQKRIFCFDAASFINWYAEHFRPRFYLEVGVRRGRSLAQVLFQSPATTAFGFDMWIPNYGSNPKEGIYTSNPGPEFVLQELRNLGCDKLPTLFKGNSHQTLPKFWSDHNNPQKIDLIFVDGDHTYAGAKQDLDICFQHLAESGALVFDDISHPSHPELEQLWNETKARYPDCIFIEHSSGMGTGVAFKPPFNNLKRFLSRDIGFPSTRKANKSEKNRVVNKSANANLPVHFFTIVLNGEPFIRYHIEVFKHLSFRWHWHIIEGVADLKHDTAWSLQNGGRISNELHQCGLSNDGTTKFLDELEKEYPENITIYRKPGGKFWSGKLEMVNAPLENIQEECLLWQVDADELWTGVQINTCRAMFMAEPDRMAAFYIDHFFVGEDLTITTIDTYGNNTAYEWLRTWRFKPGYKWATHEPPRLCSFTRDGQWIDVATIEPFKHRETAANELIFQHYAYATERQLRFKEIYYGYQNGIEGWRALQKLSDFPVFLKDYFPWVKDMAQVDRIASQNIKPLAYKDNNDQWQFNLDGSIPGLQPVTFPGRCENILFVRTDSIGDNILAMSMIPHIKGRYPKAKFTALCQEHIAELYETCPFVDGVVTFDRQRSLEDGEYRLSIIRQLQALNPDITLNSVYSREPLTDFFAAASGAKERVAYNGELCNITAEILEKHNQLYSRLLPNGAEHKPELDRHTDFLKALGIEAPPLQPMLWLTSEDQEFADDFFRSNKLKPDKTIALFAGAQTDVRIYRHYGRALSQICNDNDITIITLGSQKDYGINRINLESIGRAAINLCGKTTLRQAAAILRHCRLAVGAETGIAHIACAVGTPNVILLGGGHFGRFMPYSTLSSIVCLPLECYNCNWRCQYQKAHCIKGIMPDVIVEALHQTLSKNSKIPRVFVQAKSLWNPPEGYPGWKAIDQCTGPTDVEIIPVGAEMLSKNYLISAIVSTYNSERFIRGCLEDLERQSIAGKLEVIVVNSGSNQSEDKIVNEFQEKYSNIKYIKTKSRETVYAAWNRGIKAATGIYITNANADDRHRPDALEKLVSALEANPEAILAYGNSQVTPKENAIMGSAPLSGTFQWPDFDSTLLFRGNYIGPHPVWRRSAHNRYGWFDETLVVAGDYDFWLRMAWDEQFIHVDEPLGLYLNAPGSIEHANLKQSQKEVQLVRNRHWRKERGPLPPLDSNFFVPVEQPESKASKTSDQRLPITAIIAAYNEGDVIYHIIRDLVEQDIQVVFIDHHSSDNTLAEVRKWEGKGVVRIESFPEDAGLEIPKNVYSWRYILQRKQEIAAKMGPGWYLHTDADEFRESPWEDLNLREGIERVDREGFNAINFKIYDFKPTNNCFEPGQDVREHLAYYDPDIHAYNNVQIKCWKNLGQEINLWESGGHAVAFHGRRVYPVPFILRHYAIRSQHHGLQKIFQERKNRYDIYERKAHWHDQYDQVEDTAHNFLREEADLIPYNRKKACQEALSAGGFSKSNYYEFTRPEVQAMVSHGSQVILDVGCASGRMAGELKSKLQAEVWGIEPVEDVARQAERLLDRVIVAPVEQAIQEVPDGYFDCVIFADVLEHLQDPDRVLIEIKSKLKPTGEIVASIPNVRHWSVVKDLLEGRWEYVDAGILDRTHLRFFTRQSVQNLFKKAGIHIHDMQATTFGSQDIPAQLVRAMEQSGLQTGGFVEDANHYQYLIKGGLTPLANAPQKSPSLVTIIILTFNGLEYTKKCVNSIQAHTSSPHEIVFVDNGSTDGTPTYLKKLIASNQNYRLITNSENRGFAAGNNQGIEAAKGDYILLMNNDIVVTPGWLERMVTCAERDPRIGIVGPMSNSVSGPQQVKDVTYSITDLKGLDEYAAEFSKRIAGKYKRFMRVVGFCMLIKRVVFDKIGGLDTSFGLGNFEDDDFSLRAALAGFESWIAKDCFIHHFGNRTFIGANIDYNASLEKNWKIFKKKWELPADLQLGSKYYWTQILKKGFDRDKHYCPISQGSSKGITQKAVSSALTDNGPLKEKYQNIQQLINDGRQEEAIGVLERLLEMNPDYAMAHNDLGILYYNYGDKEKALNHYEQAVRIQPHNLTFQKNLADFYFVESGRIEDALAIYNKVLEADFGDVEALMAIGLICVSLDRPEDARHFYNRVLEHEPWNVDARRQLENLYPN